MASVSIWLRRSNQTDKEAIDVSILKQKRLIDLKRLAAEALNLTCGVAEVTLWHDKYSFEDNRATLDSLLGQYSEDDVIVVQEAAPKPVATTPEVILVRSGDSKASVQLSNLKRVLDLKRAAHQALKLGGSVSDMTLSHPKFSFDDNRTALFPLLASYSPDDILVAMTTDKVVPQALAVKGVDASAQSGGEDSDESEDAQPPEAVNVSESSDEEKEPPAVPTRTSASAPAAASVPVVPAVRKEVARQPASVEEDTDSDSDSDSEVKAAPIGRPAPPLGHDIFVGGLGAPVTELVVLDHFSRFGKVLEVNLVRDKASNKHRGFGFVKFESQVSAKKAAAQAKQTLGKFTISVRPATTSCKKPAATAQIFPKVIVSSDSDDSSSSDEQPPKLIRPPPTSVVANGDGSDNSSDDDSDSEEDTKLAAQAIQANTKAATTTTNMPLESDSDDDSEEETVANTKTNTPVMTAIATAKTGATATKSGSTALMTLLDESSEEDTVGATNTGATLAKPPSVARETPPAPKSNIPVKNQASKTPQATKRLLSSPSPAQPADKKHKPSATSSELKAPSWKNCVLLENLPESTHAELAEYINNLGYTVSAIKRQQNVGFVGFASSSDADELVGLGEEGGLFFKGQALSCKMAPKA